MPRNFDLSAIKKIFLILLSALVVAAGFFFLSEKLWPKDGSLPLFRENVFSEEEMSALKHSTPFENFSSRGLPKDSIAAIDKPKFISIKQADEFLSDEDAGVGLEYGDEARFYPLRILSWHEAVNDSIAGVPIAVTYSPLTETAIVFKRKVEGKILEFGVSQKLLNSNLILYDRATESLWSQILEEAVVGEMTGKKLETLPIEILSWKNWKELRPQSKVLSKDTGFSKPYGDDPYAGYRASDTIFFPIAHRDDRLRPKETIFGISSNTGFKAYPAAALKNRTAASDMIGDFPLIVLMDTDHDTARFFSRILGKETLEFEATENGIKDTKTGSVWNVFGQSFGGWYAGKKLTPLPALRSYWFSWAAFHPETEVYEAGNVK